MKSAKKRIMILMALSSLDGARSFGGVDSACNAHLRGLIHHGGEHEYIVLGFNYANDTPEPGNARKLSDNVTVYWFNIGPRFGLSGFTPRLIRHELVIRRMMREHSPDVVHSHALQWGLRKWCKAKKILTLHTYKNLALDKVGLASDFLHKSIIQPISINDADIITTVSHQVKSVVEKEHDVRVLYVPNAVELDESDSIREVPSVDEVRMILVCNTDPRKRVIDALELVRNLRPHFPRIKLRIAGQFDPASVYGKSLLGFLDEYNLRDSVTLLGVLSRSELHIEIKNAHLGLSMSESETFGLAPLEILLAGVPLVTTRVGVFEWHAKEFTDRGVTIIEPRDVANATQAVSELISKGNYRASEGARSFIKETFSLREIMHRYLELYEA
jgi:polysaccharide biosynthesis protein VpsD